MDDPYKSTTYETRPPPTSAPASGFALNKEYLRTVPAILKIVEIVLSILTVICASVVWFGGRTWVNFVALSAFITLLLNFLLTLFGIYDRLPPRRNLVELIVYAVFTLFFFIAAICCAVWAIYHSAIGAATFFAFAATAVFAADTFLHFRDWRSAQAETVPPPNMTTTTSMEQGPTY